MKYAVQTQNLTKQYGKALCVDHIDLKVPEGSIYGFLGPNGAGKSTTMKMLLGLVKPTEGKAQILGQTLNGKNRLNILRETGSLIESPSYYAHLTGRENLQIVCLLKQVPEKRIDEVLRIVRMEKQQNKKAGNYSLGMKQRLGIAIALAGSPDFLILDEPVNGLDPQGIIEMRELILKLNRERQITFLISSHILDELSRLATHYGFIDSGHMVKEMSAKELDSACRKCIRVQVSDIRALARVLDEMGIEYNIFSDTMADIFAKVNISKLTLALAEQECDVISLTEREESLESFYVNLIGGGNRNE